MQLQYYQVKRVLIQELRTALLPNGIWFKLYNNLIQSQDCLKDHGFA